MVTSQIDFLCPLVKKKVFSDTSTTELFVISLAQVIPSDALKPFPYYPKDSTSLRFLT